MITTKNTLAEIVSDNFRAAAVFNKHGLDFCCGGKKTIEDVCQQKGLDSGTILNEIQQATNKTQGNLNFNHWSVDFLIDYIVNNHHAYVRNTLPLILKHAEKAATAHGKNKPELKKIYEIFCEEAEELTAHMAKEEKMLFPYIKKLASADIENFIQPFGSVRSPITVMEHEHESAGKAMSQIRELTGNYNATEDLCETCRVLFKELRDFEEDLHIHVHLENNVLFPKAITLEEKMMPAKGQMCSL